MNRFFILLLLAILAFGQVGPTTIADLTGDGSTHQVSSTAISARSVDLTALAANSGTCRVGDSSISSTRGQPIAAGGSYHYQLSQLTNFKGNDGLLDLSKIYYNCASSDKLSVHYVQ